MIMTVEELRRHMDTEEDDQTLEDKLRGLELLIRGHTHNHFTIKHTGRLADIVGGTFDLDEPAGFEPGDTVLVSGVRNKGLFTIAQTTGTTFTVNEKTYDEIDAYVVKVEYPMDVKMGVVELMKWKADAGEKVGVQSESISRHSVTYSDRTAANTVKGFPAELMGFLQHYMQAQFGEGVGW